MSKLALHMATLGAIGPRLTFATNGILVTFFKRLFNFVVQRGRIAFDLER